MNRKGREYYSKTYGKAMEMNNMGVGMKEIAKQLNISYSAVYHWVRGIRKPDVGNINAFESCLRKNGPMAAIEIRDNFPKHNEIFLTAAGRGSELKRHVLERRFGGYATWYFLPGQEEMLKKRIRELLDRYKELRDKMSEALTPVHKRGV